MRMDRYKHTYFFNNSPNGLNDYKQTNYCVNFGFIHEFDIPAKKWPHPKAPWTMCALEIGKHHTLCIGYGYTPGGQCATFAFNPAKLDDYGHTALNVCINGCLVEEMHAFKQYGHIGSAEIAIDVEGAEYFDYHYVDLQVRSSDSYFSQAGTSYLGAATSPRSIKCYSKSKELLEKHGVAGPPILRIEATLVPTQKTKLLAMAGVNNPFASVVVLDHGALYSYKSSGQVIKLVKLMNQGMSAQEAYRSLVEGQPADYRKSLNHHLRMCAPTWWKPSEIWTEHAPGLVDWVN